MKISRFRSIKWIIASSVAAAIYGCGEEQTDAEESRDYFTVISSEEDVHYRNCDAARAAGAAPLYRGDPGYRPKLDRDRDGIACEPYPR